MLRLCSLFSILASSLTSFFLFFSTFWNLDNSFSCSALMRFASSRKRFVCSCSRRSIVCFCCFSRFSISWSYCRFLLCKNYLVPFFRKLSPVKWSAVARNGHDGLLWQQAPTQAGHPTMANIAFYLRIKAKLEPSWQETPDCS